MATTDWRQTWPWKVMDWEKDPARMSQLLLEKFLQRFLAELPQPPKVGMGKANFL